MGKKKNISFHWFWIIAVICIAIWSAVIIATHFLAESIFDTKPELLGDSAGAVNALFSALALAGVILAVLMQRQELKIQQDELQKTTEALNQQKEEFVAQNKTLKRQQFENTFFNMMSLQQEIVDGLKCGKTVSREIFERFYAQPSINFNGYTSSNLKELLIAESIDIYTALDEPAYFDHYFRHLYRIIKFVDKNEELTHDKKYSYISMVRATLSRYELVWLFYNSLSVYGKEKFKPLIKQYAILKNIREELLANNEDRRSYEDSAFEQKPANDKL